MGSQGDTYSVQEESKLLLSTGILANPLNAGFPKDLINYAKLVTFSGSATPSIPINWRLAESLSSLKALESCFVNALLVRKYKVEPATVTINTDHASLYMMSTLVMDLVDEEGESIDTGMPTVMKMAVLFPPRDPYRSQGSTYRSAASNIYKTKDGRYYHIHGSLNPEPTLKALGLPTDLDGNYDVSIATIQDKVGQFDSADLDILMNNEAQQAGTICYDKEEYFNSEHGKANEKFGLYELQSISNTVQAPGWWAESPNTSPKRPLAGLKIVDLTRVIAGPSITRGLAELGASVMRVTAPHIPDTVPLHADLNWGKWNCELDLRNEIDREKLKVLIAEADVFVDGYRPGVMEKYGFGMQDVLALCNRRPRGIIYLRENCYGWNGPWKGRSGWQQISDGCCGVSMEFGRAMGNDEAVTPVFPNSDYCTGVIGVCAVLDALIKQGESGGSWVASVSLNYYSQWLVRSCGTYPADVWETLWTKNGKPVFRSYHNMLYTLPAMLKLIFTNSAATLFKPEFFEMRLSKAINMRFKVLKPVAQFKGGEVEPGYNLGTRSNGLDMPVWPKDLLTEVVG